MTLWVLRSEADLRCLGDSDGPVLWLPQAPVPQAIRARAIPLPSDPPLVEGWLWVRRWGDERVGGQPIKELLEYRGVSLWWFVHYWLVYGETLPTFDELHRVLTRVQHALALVAVTEIVLCSTASIDDLVLSVLAREHGLRYRWARPWVRRAVARWMLGRRTLVLNRLRLGKLVLRGFLARRLRKNSLSRRPSADLLFNTSSVTWSGASSRDRILQPLLEQAREAGWAIAGLHLDFRRNLGIDTLRSLDRGIVAWESLVTPNLVRQAFREARRLRRRWVGEVPGMLAGVPAAKLLEHRVRCLLRGRLVDAVLAIQTATLAVAALRPRCIAVIDEYDMWGRALVVAGRRAGARVLGVQHGVIDANHFGYLHLEHEVGTGGTERAPFSPLPHITAVYGPSAAETLERVGHYPPDLVRITGSMALEEVRSRASEAESVRRRLGYGRDDVVVLFFGVPDALAPVDALHVRAILSSAASLPVVRLVLRPHPGDGSNPRRYRDGAARAGVPAAVLMDADPWDLIQAADIVITYNSTTALDAMALRRAVIHLNLSGAPDLFPFVTEGLAIGAYAEGDLLEALRTLLAPERRAEQVRRQQPYVDRVFAPMASPSRAILELAQPKPVRAG